MSRNANSVALVGRILAHIAAEPPCTATEIAVRLGAARTTTFEVLRRLESAGLVERDSLGLVGPGAAAASLGFAALGLTPIAGAAEALVSALHDTTGLDAQLVVRHGGADCVLVRRGANERPMEDVSAGAAIEEAPLQQSPVEALLRVKLSGAAPADERERVRRPLRAVAAALDACFPSLRRPTARE